MLPHGTWYHYYDRPCDFCGENVEMRDDDCWAECETCHKLMCDECRHNATCHVCDEKLERGGSWHFPDICEECMQSCSKCQVLIHPSCKAEHAKVCNKKGRAERAVDEASSLVESKEQAVRQLKRMVATAEKELKTAKKKKVKAEMKLAKIVTKS